MCSNFFYSDIYFPSLIGLKLVTSRATHFFFFIIGSPKQSKICRIVIFDKNNIFDYTKKILKFDKRKQFIDEHVESSRKLKKTYMDFGF